MKKITFHIKEAGSVINVIDGGHPFITMDIEDSGTCETELCFGACVPPTLSVNNVIDAIVPFGAIYDPTFVRNVEKAKSIKECQDICNSWTNV